VPGLIAARAPVATARAAAPSESAHGRRESGTRPEPAPFGAAASPPPPTREGGTPASDAPQPPAATTTEIEDPSAALRLVSVPSATPAGALAGARGPATGTADGAAPGGAEAISSDDAATPRTVGSPDVPITRTPASADAGADSARAPAARGADVLPHGPGLRAADAPGARPPGQPSDALPPAATRPAEPASRRSVPPSEWGGPGPSAAAAPGVADLPPLDDLRSQGRTVAPGPAAPVAAAGRPALPWPDTAGGPRTVIDPDDLKTAFFISDSAFGPLPPGDDERPQRLPAVATGRAIPASPNTPGRRLDPPTVARNGDPETVARPQAPPTVLRREVDPLAGFQTDPLPPDDAAALTRAGHREPLRDATLAPDAGEPAIDYFAPPRGRSRSLGLALSPAAWVAAAVLTVLLVGQALVGWRDAIAARQPLLSPVLSAIVAPLGLQVAPPREIGAMTIESFELQATASPNVLQVTALLRNRGGHVVAFPAMELTLTDSAGAVLVRKVIAPAVYLPDPVAVSRGLGERSEWPIRLALEHRGLQPTGYAVALYYP